MRTSGFVAVLVRMLGLYLLLFAFQSTGTAMFVSKIGGAMNVNQGFDDPIVIVSVLVIYAVALILISFPTAVTAVLMIRIRSEADSIGTSGVIAREVCYRVAYRVAGVVLCVVALADAAAISTWYLTNGASQQIKTNQMVSQLIGPCCRLLFGAALAAAAGLLAPRDPSPPA